MKQPKTLELKFRGGTTDGASGSSCCSSTEERPEGVRKLPHWMTGTVMTRSGPVPRVSTGLSGSDRWEHVRCRISAFRETYTVRPGLYAVGDPGGDSDVLVSANYKLSFDTLRGGLEGLNVWILVLDTKGINVWCAAGKGTFGTAELVKRLQLSNLNSIVKHRRIIVPQLGAPGVSAHMVARATGFRVHYGPVRAKDIPAYIKSGYKATAGMRKVEFGLFDRLVLTPMEINPALKKYPLFGLIVLAMFGLSPSGILFKDALAGIPFLVLGLISVLAGALFTPLLLPFIPFRSFAIKGWIIGLLSIFLLIKMIPLGPPTIFLVSFTYIFFPLASSYIALQFTGSTTFTGMSGVKKELRIAIPTYFVFSALSLVLLILHKLVQWRAI